MNSTENASLAHWLVERKIYYVRLENDPMMSKFRAVFRSLSEVTAISKSSIYLVVDATNMEVALSTWNCVIETQLQLRSIPITRVYIVGQSHNRLMRLMMIRLFDMAHTSVTFCNTIDEAMKTIPAEC